MSVRLLAIIAGAIVLDQALKAAAVSVGFPRTSGAIYHPLLALAVTIVALWGLTKHPSVGLSLIIGGGVSNLLDIALHRQVLDIFVVKNLAFNLADAFILLGFLFIAVNYFHAREYKA